jgi:hypothetical protein
MKQVWVVMSAAEASNPATRADARTPSYLEAVKLLGAGNSTGFVGALAALYYFAPRWPTALLWIIGTAAVYLLGICLFAVAFQLLTIFSIQQAQGVKNREGLEKLRTWLVRVGVASLVAWWLGTLGTVFVIGVFILTEPR